VPGLLLLLAACGGGDAASVVRAVPPGMPTEGALLRLPSEGGRARLYRADSLTPLDWQIASGVPKIVRALGTELEDRMVYAVDTDGRLVGIDLLARRTRIHLAATQQLTATPDGAVLGLDSARRAVRFSSRALTTYRASVEGGGTPQLLRGPGGQVAAYLPAANVLQLLGEDGEVRRFTAPAGQATASWHGDLLAVTTDSGLVLFDPSGRSEEPLFLRLRGAPVTTAFSPSAHRLYVARGRGDIVVLDRFTGDERATIELPAPAKTMRVDRSGRWLLAQPESGDSVWVVDLVQREVALTIQSPWAEDLPLVAGGRTLVVRDGADVVAWELTGTTPTERTRLVGAASDIFLAIPWSPEAPAATEPAPVVIAEDETPTPAPTVGDSVLTEAPSVPAAREPTGDIYLQISSSQNREWAQALAQQLRDGGFAARLLNPTDPSDPYRVVIGPFATREEADAVGRRLGRPYFVLSEAPSGT
jgi:hypothetical protein